MVEVDGRLLAPCGRSCPLTVVAEVDGRWFALAVVLVLRLWRRTRADALPLAVVLVIRQWWRSISSIAGSRDAKKRADARLVPARLDDRILIAE